MRILYLQYTNPAGYPALIHSSGIFADRGWEVLFLGTEASGTKGLAMPSRPRARVRQWRCYPPGWKQKLHYGAFGLWTLWSSGCWHPDWIYASDPLSAPLALPISRLCGGRVLYHEHDTPNPWSCHPLLLDARRKLAQRAGLCVLPNQERAEIFRESTRTPRPVVCCWNCPSREEAVPIPRANPDLILHYHGNIGPELVPLCILDALTLVPRIRFRVIGYSTRGQEPYVQKLLERAHNLGLSERVEVRPALARNALLEETRSASIGLALMPVKSPNLNFATMIGASNKPFDYLACGVPVLVSDLDEWRTTFVGPGYGLACDPRDPQSIAQVLNWFVRHRSEARLMGELGRQRVLKDWNYEHQFAPVLEKIRCASERSAGALPACSPFE